ncbi:hypothetical protein JW911_04350 [Candidatus Peregrinibacteria bacterium]|nr:hypothetical protein [Candidatus Peregrinibacteria bacterium]
MKKITKKIAVTLAVLFITINGILTVFADYPRQMTGGGDNILDPGETLSGTEEWGDIDVYDHGKFHFEVDASAAVAGEDITFTYTPIGPLPLEPPNPNSSNIAMSVSNDENPDSCFKMNFSGYDPVECVLSNATGGGTYTIEINHNNGSPCDHIDPMGQPECDAHDFFSTMDATATDSGGGPVPEFHEYMLIISIGILLYFMAKKLPNISGTPMTKA